MNYDAQEINIKDIENDLGYRFKRPELLLQAFRHSSYVNEQADPNLRDNERLEFLGDAVLDLAISHLLMKRFPDAAEGLLSKYRSMAVNEAGLNKIARKFNLGEYLLLGKGEEQSRGREKPSILANSMEALIGAIYLDGGFRKSVDVIRRLFAPLLGTISTPDKVHDYKSLLQENTQRIYKTLPKYKLAEEHGPAHDKTFKVILTINGEIMAEGEGKSKKEAEQKAARRAFLCLEKDQDPS